MKLTGKKIAVNRERAKGMKDRRSEILREKCWMWCRGFSSPLDGHTILGSFLDRPRPRGGSLGLPLTHSLSLSLSLSTFVAARLRGDLGRRRMRVRGRRRRRGTSDAARQTCRGYRLNPRRASPSQPRPSGRFFFARALPPDPAFQKRPQTNGAARRVDAPRKSGAAIPGTSPCSLTSPRRSGRTEPRPPVSRPLPR
jgi:hypothetical protein